MNVQKVGLRRKKSKVETTKARAKAKDKKSVKQTVFWAGNSSRQKSDTPPSDSGYSGPAWLTQTYHNNKNNERGLSQSTPGGVSKKI
jgi:hypothetical protein